MNCRLLSLEDFPRAGHFSYFLQAQNPFFSLTVPVDITDFVTAQRRGGDPFFLSLLCCVSKAANAVAPFRQRIWEGQPVEYDYCLPSYTLMLEDDTYVYAEADPRLPFDEYLSDALQRQTAARQKHKLEENTDDPLSLLFISSSPWHTYTALTMATMSNQDSVPRIAWGKYTENNGKITLPLTVQVHHALMDGIHIARFLDALAENLKAYADTRFDTI